MNQNHGSYGGYGPPPPHGYPHGAHHPAQYRPPADRPEHPSANRALVLGLVAVCCLGAFCGVPAIHIGRNAITAIENEPYRWRGEPSAKAGILLGWISVVETALAVMLLTAQAIAPAVVGIVVSGIGLALLGIGAAKKLPSPIAAITKILRKAPLAVGMTLGGIFVGSLLGLASAITTAQQLARECSEEKGKYERALADEHFVEVRTAADTLERTCHRDAAEITAMRHAIEAKELDVKKRKEDADRERLARVAAEREQSAVTNFPEARKDIASLIRSAQSKAAQGEFGESGWILSKAENKLADFKETSMERTKEYTDLVKQIADRRRAIQPQLDRIEAKLKKERDEEARKDALRGEMPVNSARDGSIPAVEKYLKLAMHDPKSYQHVGTTVPVAEGDYWTVVSSFRGKNKFGALILTTQKFYIQQGHVVKTTSRD